MAKRATRTTRILRANKEDLPDLDVAEEESKLGKRQRTSEKMKPAPKKSKAAAPKASTTKKTDVGSKKAAKNANLVETPNMQKKTAATGQGPEISGFWLIKSEPDEYSLDHLKNETNSTGFWDGVRNLQARNLLQKMKLGDMCFFYHSSCKVPGIVGIAEVVEEATPDMSAFDESSENFDPKSDKAKPRWYGVRVQFRRALRRQITLEELKKFKEGPLSGLTLLRVPRLSVQTVSKADWDFILSKEDEDSSA